jgi:8-oxo-dGTP pyrophosphatase MutT (NUDIX family)
MPGPETLAAAAIRELFEETGLALGRPGVWPGTVPAGWEGFAARGLLPDAAALHFLFRAITPPGRPRCFDARFFLVDAAAVAGDLDDFSAASDELSHLHWIGLSEARALDLPFITEVVLAEVGAWLRDGPSVAGVPFFDNSGSEPRFRRLL